MGTESKKHHYVPQSTLKRFASDSKQSRIFVLDKLTLKPYNSSIIDAGCENYFNTMELDGETINFECLFQKLDDNLPGAINVFLENESLVKLSAENKVDIAAGVAAQILRSKMMRTMHQAMTEDLRNSLQRGGYDLSRVQDLDVPTEDEAKLFATSMLLEELPALIAVLLNKKWRLLKSNSNIDFIISDNPVVYGNPFPYGDWGLHSLGVEFYFPASPRLTLNFLCPSVVRRMDVLLQQSEPEDARKLRESLDDLAAGKPHIVDTNDIMKLNTYQIRASSRFLYSSTNDFSMAQSLLVAEPGLREVRSRHVVSDVGKGGGVRQSMPPGLWAAFFCQSEHYLVKVESWADESQFDFTTKQVVRIQNLANELHIEKALLIQDGHDRVMMRGVRIEVTEEGGISKVRVLHKSDFLNQIKRPLDSRRENVE